MTLTPRPCGSNSQPARFRLGIAIGLFQLLALVPPSSVQAAADSSAQAQPILDAAKTNTGLCLVIGCGGEKAAGLTAALAASGPLLVHGLAVDDAAVERERKIIAAQGRLGQANVEKMPAGALPYVANLANLVVVADPALLARQQIKPEELERVVAPGGSICILKDGQWTRTVKARPAAMDDWPHPWHGVDGNRVSTDHAIRFPLGLRWEDGIPLNFIHWASCRGVVVAAGRCFTLGSTVLDNLSTRTFLPHQNVEYLTARDAYNGLPLWKVNCETTNPEAALNKRNTAPLITDGKRVFTYQKNQVAAYDAATGKVLTTYPVHFKPVRLLLSGNVLLSSGWEGVVAKGLWDAWTTKTLKGAVEAFDADTGQPKWSVPLTAQNVLVADGTAYVLFQTPEPPEVKKDGAGSAPTSAPAKPALPSSADKKQEIAAFDLQTGQERWRFAHTAFSPEADLELNNVGLGVVVLARTKTKAITVLSAETGYVLWEIKDTDKFWTPMVDGQLWQDKTKYDPKTGEVKGKLILPTVTLGAGTSGMCTPMAIVGDILASSRGGSYFELALNPASQPAKTQNFFYKATRGGCLEGAVPAGGMFFSAQNYCRCSPGQVPGFVGFGPCGEVPAQADFENPRPVETGPAFGKVPAQASADAGWPMLRGNPERTAASAVQLPPKFKILWQTPVATPPAGPLADAWKCRLESFLSAPVVADGKVFVACTEIGQIAALDAATGQPSWQFTAGGRINTPPTISQGLCLFGCCDGYLYALRASDGALAWRVRVAPLDKKMTAFGQVESLWPVIGSVLAYDGLVYASAGRTTESDGGLAVCAFEPASGKQVWARMIGPKPQRQNDMLFVRNGRIALHHLDFDPQTGAGNVAATQPAPESQLGLVPGLAGFYDGTWTRLGNRRSGGHRFGGKVPADLCAWNDATLFGYEVRGGEKFGHQRTCFAMLRKNIAGLGEKFKGKDYAWLLTMGKEEQPEAMALTANYLVLAGVVADAKNPKTSGFLCLVSPEKGEKVWQMPLDAAPVYEGLAITPDRLYLSLQDGRVVCLGKDE